MPLPNTYPTSHNVLTLTIFDLNLLTRDITYQFGRFQTSNFVESQKETLGTGSFPLRGAKKSKSISATLEDNHLR